jgi:NADH:ubiquinone oxidoreductase subunit 2 (subunit N)
MAQTQIGPDLLRLLPALTTFVTAVLALAAQMITRPRWSLWITEAGLLVASALAVPLLGAHETVFTGTYRIDSLSTWAALVLLPATVLVVALAEPEVRGTAREGAVYSLMAFTSVGALVLAGAGDVSLAGFGRASPLGGAALVVCLLSLVGVPPFAGFFGKLLLFGAALDADFGWLAVVAVLNSVLSLAVYLRLIVPAYQTAADKPMPSLGLVAAASAALVVGLGVGIQVLLGGVS